MTIDTGKFANSQTDQAEAAKMVRQASNAGLNAMIMASASWPERYNLAVAERARRDRRILWWTLVCSALAAFGTIAAIFL
jgi:hypothetical protein